MKEKNTQKLCQLLAHSVTNIDLVKVSKLIYKEADVNAMIDLFGIKQPLIFMAIWHNNPQLLALLLNNGADIKQHNSSDDDIYNFAMTLIDEDRGYDYKDCIEVLKNRINYNSENDYKDCIEVLKNRINCNSENDFSDAGSDESELSGDDCSNHSGSEID